MHQQSGLFAREPAEDQQLLTVADLKEEINAGKTFRYIYFWRDSPKTPVSKTCLSQWWDCTFVCSGTTYHTAEQYMMAQKALLFGDRATEAKIMGERNPAAYKKLGREVKNFNGALWDKHKRSVVVRGNYAKFSQNPELRDFLLKTAPCVLVEASPYDGVWGIRMSEKDRKAGDPALWQGENLLGFCLMYVRDMLLAEAGQ